MNDLQKRYTEIVSKIVILTSYRDAVRQVALNQIFKSPQHRDEIYMAIIEALEDLEDELEEIEEQLEAKERD